MNVNKKLIALFLLALFIRLYNISYFVSYGTETAQHYFEIIKLAQGTIFINGPLTSHPWLRLGSVPYYLFFPILYLTGFHPLTLFYVWVIVDIGTVFLNYYVVKKIFNGKIALVSTLFLSLSPLMLLTNRAPGFYNFVIPLTYILILYIHKVLRKKTIPYWPVFLIVGLMTSLHASTLFLIPFFICLGMYLKKFSKSSIIFSLGAFILPNIPFFISDFFRNFSMTRNLLFWFPYKVYNFLLGKTLGVNRVSVKDETLIDIFNFFKSTIFSPQYHFVFGIFFIILLFFYFLFRKNPLMVKILYSWLFFGIIALVIHKNPPIHYFISLFILPILLISYILGNLLINRKTKKIAFIIIICIVVSDLLFIFSPRYLFLDRKKTPLDIQYKTQENITKYIIQDANGRKFSISKIGPLDHYAGGSKENYEYLLWWMGNKPEKNSSLHYTIVEDINRMPKNVSKRSMTYIDGLIIFSSYLRNP